MGRFTYEIFDPDELELPNDTDFEIEGIDEEYESYQEYEAYLPDLIGELVPLDRDTLAACESATKAMREACERVAASDVAPAIGRLLLLDEAVSTTQIENYNVSCESALDYIAASGSGYRVRYRDAEATAVAAIDALRDFLAHPELKLTLSELCAANETFSRTSPRADLCGSLRERPVFIGRSLFDADYVAPPADTLEDYMADIVRFANGRPASLDPTARAAIAQLQLVTVHPFEDGNGRTSRAISQWVLRANGVTGELVLPVSTIMFAQSPDYVDAIQKARNGSGPVDVSDFVRLFASCCERAALRAVSVLRGVEDALQSSIERLQTRDASMWRAMQALAAEPVKTKTAFGSGLGVDAAPLVDALIEAGVMERRRSRFCEADVYVATDILRALGGE